MNKFEWNPVFKLVMRIKKDYSETFETMDTLLFQDWLARLNKDEYLEVFKHLKVNQYNNFVLISYMRQKYLGQDYNVLKTCYKESTKYRKLSEIDLDGLSQAAIDDLEDT